MACLFEGIVREAPIVAVIVLDPNAKLGNKGLEGVFGGNNFNPRVIDLRVEVSHVTVVVNEDGSATIALLDKFAFELCNKPYLCQCHLVNRNALHRLGCNKDFVRRLGLFAAPRNLCHCAKETACALGWCNLGKFLGDFTIDGELLELRKW